MKGDVDFLPGSKRGNNKDNNKIYIISKGYVLECSVSENKSRFAFYFFIYVYKNFNVYKHRHSNNHFQSKNIIYIFKIYSRK